MSTEADIFDVNKQGEYLKRLGNDLSNGLKKKAMDPEAAEGALDSMSVIDTVINSMRTADPNIDPDYITALESLKTDSEIIEAIQLFEDALEGRANMLDLQAKVPQADGDHSIITVPFKDDAGLQGKILTGESDGKENDLIRYSNYISGAGTTFGGFMTDIGSLNDLAEGSINVNLRKYARLQDKLEKQTGELGELLDELEKDFKTYGFKPEVDLHRRRNQLQGVSADISGDTARHSLSEISIVPGVIRSEQLKQKASISAELLETRRIKSTGRLRAQKILGKVGNVANGATTAFGFATGGVDLAAGDQMIENAERRYKAGEISKDEYNIEMRNGRLRIAQGAFAVGDGLNSLRAIIVGKTSEAVQKTSKQAARIGLRFASVAGGAMSIGMGITSIAKNAIAADDARRAGNHGRAAMYGIMAALDCVSVVLDGVSVALDLIPGIGQAVSFVVDLINTVVGLASMVIGFFADMVDTRSDEEKLQDAFDEYIESEAFEKYIDNQAKVYKDQGYDLFQFIIDAKAVGLEEGDADATAVDKTILRELSAQAEADAQDPNLRLALIDASSIGRELRGRMNDDLIRAGAGDDQLYGEGGDDLLFGEADNDTIYGGPGNDFINGGTGRNTLFGGKGDDWIVIKPGFDSVDGQEGRDTLEISSDFHGLGQGVIENRIRYGSDSDYFTPAYVDLSQQASAQGRGGIALGALVKNLADLNNPMHKPAFDPAYDAALINRLVNTLFWRGGETSLSESTLNDTYLWYLAKDNDLKYLTDGQYLYAWGTRNGSTGVWQASYRIADINVSAVAEYDQENKAIKYKGSDGNMLEAIFAFAFKGTGTIAGIEKVCEGIADEASLFTDIHSQVIGDESVTLIDVLYGHNEYIYTGNGNTLVSFAAANSPQWEIVKYIIGGEGQNTLIINGSSGSRYSRNGYVAADTFVLLDHDLDLAQADRTASYYSSPWPSNAQENKVDRAVFLKNMNTIQLSSNADDLTMFNINAINLSAGHRFIIDTQGETFKLTGTAGDDTFLVKNVKGINNDIDGYSGRNTLSLEYFAGTPVTVDLGSSFTQGFVDWGDKRINLKNIESVRGNHKTTHILGHTEQDSLLIVNGGSCTVESRDGSNTLVAMRGRHTLIGGKDKDTYVIQGPNITDRTTISISNDKDQGIVARSNGGNWANNQLTIDLLAEDHNDITITDARIVDQNGNAITDGSKGSLTYNNGRQLVYSPNSRFNHLETYRSETIRVEFDTRGSSATLRESGIGNKIKLAGFQSSSQIRLHIAQNGDLQLRTNDAGNHLILTDEEWGNQYRSGITELGSLIVQFTQRFMQIEFDGSGSDSYSDDEDDANKNLLEGTDVIEFLFKKLGDRVRDLNTNEAGIFNNIIDAGSLSGNSIDLGDGDNIILAKRRNVTYSAGSGNDIFDASVIDTANVGGNAQTIIETGTGSDLVVIGDNPYTLHIYFKVGGVKQGNKIVMVKNVDLNQLTLSQNGDQLTLIHGGNTLAVLDTAPDALAFQENDQTIIVEDVPSYVSTRIAGTAYYGYRQVLNNQRELKLRAYDTTRANATLGIVVKNYGYEVQVRANGNVIYIFTIATQPGDQLDAYVVAQTAQLVFRDGIEFSDTTITNPEVRTFIMDKLRDPAGHIVVGSSTFANVLDMSIASSPASVNSGNTLVYANKSHTVVQAGSGDDVFKVSASDVTLGVGSNMGGNASRDIVQIQRGVTNTTVNFKNPNSGYKEGWAYLILEGLSSDHIQVTDTNGNALTGYYFASSPVHICDNGTVVAKLDYAPTKLLFRNGDEYEVHQSGMAVLDNIARGNHPTKYYLNRDNRLYVDLSHIHSSEFKILATRYSVVFQGDDDANYNLHQYNMGTATTLANVSQLVVAVMTGIPGGIHFSDRSYVGGDAIALLSEKLLNAQKDLITITDDARPLAELSASLESNLLSANPNQDLIDVIAALNQSITIENLDPPGYVPSAEAPTSGEQPGAGTAGPVIVNNPSFESVDLNQVAYYAQENGDIKHGWLTSHVHQWDVGPTWNTSILWPSDSLEPVVSGRNCCQIDAGGYISQTLGESFDQNHNYQLSVYITNRRYSAGVDFALRLWAGSTRVGEYTINDGATPASRYYRGVWTHYTLDVTGSAYAAAHGQPLKVEIANIYNNGGVIGAGDIYVDNITLARV